jgi:hypothetical protein
VLWAGDTRRKLLVNVEAYGGAVALVTVTAPGARDLPWDESVCAHLGKHRHSGKLGCKVDERAAHLWNLQAPGDWRRLHRKASTRARRAQLRYCEKAGIEPGDPWAIIAREWEFQARGVLHMHAVVPMATPEERAASRAYVDCLRDLGERHAFGFVDRKLEVVPAQRAARYVAKYIAAVDSGSGKITLSETVTHRDVPRHVTYVSRRLTMRTGVTMRSLRRKRYAWWLIGQISDSIDAETSEALARLGGTVASWSDEDVIAELGAVRGP